MTDRKPHEAIPNSKLLVIPAAENSASIEAPRDVSDAIGAFLKR